MIEIIRKALFYGTRMKGDYMRDILYKNEDFIFSYRVGGILIDNGRILLQRYKNDYTVIGGHVCGMETNEETLKREFEEELGVQIEVDDLMAVGENFFKWDGIPWHQICMYYKIHLCDFDTIPMNGEFHGQDEWEDGIFDLDFCWVPLDELERIHILPKELIPYILSDEQNIGHFVSKQTD